MFANPLFAAMFNLQAQTNSLQMRPQNGFQNPPPLIPPPPAAAAAAAAEEESYEEQAPIVQAPVFNPIQTSLEMQAFHQHQLEHLKIPSFISNVNRSLEVENMMMQEKAFIPMELPQREELQKEYKGLKPLAQVSKTSKKISKAKAPKLTRKIVKNFGKAIASFACSEKALQIIEKSVHYRGCDRKKFKDFVYEHKECIEGNRRFKQLLTISNDDPQETRENKKIFKKISEIFMKSYVHQWIWNSKLLKKEDHAQLVSEMKKRIQNPSLLESLSN